MPVTGQPDSQSEVQRRQRIDKKERTTPSMQRKQKSNVEGSCAKDVFEVLTFVDDLDIQV